MVYEYNYVYKIINKVNGKFYIGSHITNDLNDGYFGSGTLLKRAIKKHGSENFVKQILQIYDNEIDARKKEGQYLKQIFKNNVVTYNLLANVKGSYGCSEQTRNKMSVIRKEFFAQNPQAQLAFRKSYKKTGYGDKNPFYGKHHSQETKQKLRQIRTGSKNSQESKNKISLGLKKYYSNIQNRQKLSQSHKGIKHIYTKFGVCPHCNIKCDMSNLRRWHLDNCKYKNNKDK